MRVAHHEKLAEIEVGWFVCATLDRHGRSHNIAAECCVWSRGERVDFSSRSMMAGGMCKGDMVSMGSCLMWEASWKMSSVGDAGLAAASAVPCDSTRDGAGVSALAYVSIRSRPVSAHKKHTCRCST